MIDEQKQIFENISEQIEKLNQEIYKKIAEANPDGVHLNSKGFLVIKQRPDFHSFSILVHSRMAGGIMQWVLDSKMNNDLTPGSFFNSQGVQGFINQIFTMKDIDEENELRLTALSRAKELAAKLNFQSDEITNLILGAFLHDIGKFLEPEVKYMEEANVLHARKIRYAGNKPVKIPNPFLDDILKTTDLDQNHNPHLHDNLTIYFYQSLLTDNLLTNETVEELVKVHKAFTQLSMERYDSSITDWSTFLFSLGDSKLVSKALLILVADELAKGVKFIDDLDRKAHKQRINKFKYLLDMIDLVYNKVS